MAKVHIEVKAGDILAIRADVLALKHAQALYGVDQVVVGALAASGRAVHLPEPWRVRLEASVPGVAAARVLFVGVPPLEAFGYREIRTFAHMVLAALSDEVPQARNVLLTVHGAGYGLDESEAFESEVAGLVDAIREGESPETLQKITIVERDLGRAKRLASTLSGLLPNHTITAGAAADGAVSTTGAERLRSAGIASEAKPHVFVAMPFKDEMDDVYHYGIQSAANSAGFLCERADLSTFTGDVLEWVRSRIRSAALVVADLTDANPNVYLEVGYAWGVGVPTVLVVKSADQLKFDVRGQRCLVYKKIKDLEDSLRSELKRL